MDDFEEMPLTEIIKLDGVSDLEGMQVKGQFAKALKAEASGNLIEANDCLNKAIDAETKANQLKQS